MLAPRTNPAKAAEHWQRFEAMRARRARAWRAYNGAMRRNAARIDPRMSGDSYCCLFNWGSAEAQAYARRAESRWRRFSDASDIAEKNELRDRERALGFNPLW